jgi:predicted RNase H-like HicB family nuclease
MNVECTVHVWREGEQFVAHAMPIDVMSSGTTAQAARDAVDEAVRAFLAAAREHGTLEQVLEECGYTKRAGVWTGPDWVGIERHSVRLAG